MPETEWRLAELLPEGLAPELDVWSHPLRQILYNRGCRTSQDVESFLFPENSCRHDPFLFLGMDVAVDRIFRALRQEEIIAVYGDFDVDGLTAVALLCEVLESPSLQGRVISYLPHRTLEGYGLNNEAIRTLSERGVGLLITVDCGIGADDQIRYAASLGMDVIVTDHHLISKGTPPALAVLNSHQDGCAYPFKDLAGVGVAYKLAEALFSRIWGIEEARERLRPQLDLVALGLVADVAPLLGENRLLVKLGIEEMGKRRRLGLSTLLRSAVSSDRVLDTDCISYVLAPRLNAAGRMGDARLSLDLLLSDSDLEAARITGLLEEANRARQSMTAIAVSTARQEILGGSGIRPAVVVVGDYPAGIVGLVAGKLAEEFGRPAFVLEYGEQECRGSGRGVPGFDVVQALATMPDILTRYGGHAQAGGFAFPTLHLDDVRSRLEATVAGQIGASITRPVIQVDASLRLADVGPVLYRDLTLLEPFGASNPRPLFCSRNLLVRESRIVGNGHLKLWLSDATASCSAIGFGMANGNRSAVVPGSSVDCIYSISRNERGSSVSYELVLKDILPSDAAPKVL